jgi:type VI secretion system secreted protein Hcp
MAGNLFLKIDGITGECAETNYVGCIDVESYSLGLQSAGSAGYGGGAGVGAVSFNDITITCQLEKAIPNLMAGCADHKHYPKATLTATKMGGNGKSHEYMKIVIKDVVITGVHYSGSANQIPHVQVSINFAEINNEYFEQTATGGQGASTQMAWSIKQNTKK